MESSKKSFSATAYKQQFKREKYDRLELTMPKGKKQRIQVLAASYDLSVNALIMGLIDGALRDFENGKELLF